MGNRWIGIVAALGLLSSAEADVFYVDGGSIQTAIFSAVDGDEIVVAPGTYFEAINFYSKAITVRSTGGPEVTTIDGTGFLHVVRCVTNEQPDSVLDGFTITGGNANGAYPDDRGGGMYIYSARPTVKNCIVTGNTAILHGGGMAADIGGNGASPVVTDCLFEGNTVGSLGGGVYVNGSNSSPALTSCTFRYNAASFSGGGMFITRGSPILTGCTFESNTATNFGGGIVATQSGTIVTNTVFLDNSTAGSGGAVSLGGSPVPPDPVLANCGFFGNWADESGGAIYNDNLVDPMIINCTFSNNAVGTPGGGGGMFTAGLGDPTVANCVFWNNGPDEFVGEHAAVTYSDVEGEVPGVGNIDADPLFVDPNNGDYRLAAGSPCIDAGDNAVVPQDVTTDLDGNPRFLDVPETPDTGNGDPPIVDMGTYESLGGGCLALSSLENVCHPDGTTFTLNVEGHSACTGDTVMATFTGSGGAVGEDLCFTVMVGGEQGGFCCSTQVCVAVPDCSEALADLDGDGIVGVTDLMLLLSLLGPCPESCPADMDHDGMVGVTDLLILLGSWS